MLSDKNGQPFFSPGALWRFLFVVFAVAASYFVQQALDFSEKPKVMPPEISAAAADCILSNNPKSCAIYEGAKPDYPIDPNRAGR